MCHQLLVSKFKNEMKAQVKELASNDMFKLSFQDM